LIGQCHQTNEHCIIEWRSIEPYNWIKLYIVRTV